jgi:adenosylcobinamide kinase/adenosylcobinamide-phosphate guanylyltransferase
MKLEANRTHFVTGGARSGKTACALRLAEQTQLEKWMIVTAEPADAEMERRIAKHRAERGLSWQVVEEPVELAQALKAHLAPNRVVVVDCLTLWLSNLMGRERDIDAEVARLCALARATQHAAIFVTNELGMGLVPETPLGRAFRDRHGLMNQKIAESCGAATFVVSGIATKIK